MPEELPAEEGGILRPERYRYGQPIGRVLAVKDGAGFSKGDRVVYRRSRAIDLELGRKTVSFVRIDDVLGVIQNGNTG